ncbi:replicative DNA helicase [Lentilactobacillus sp. SPB1-3]|uniref:Replicative DNA helicase n=1 Tax=Lentilactobacillus terminaliae TaxID=3003483 RepID=A0ACD5DCN5_9LACO|nr:DnaB-like helicase C-terminal domain-containing protein [Lentilactobacillus sp. SPB1-3]MCZ0978060.1 DnaB-like helicase C-terminal domain-containing protein [Lentilactobacillus sp. SPB1-3]
MNNEERVISILLNRPANRLVTKINAEWFEQPTLRFVYEAIMQLDPEQVNSLTIMGQVKYNHPNADVSSSKLNELKNQFITDSQLEMYVMQMRYRYLVKDLQNKSNQYINAPVSANLEELKNVIGLLENVKQINDDGDLQQTIEQLEQDIDHERPTGIKTLSQLDKVFNGGLYGGMLFTIGARPSVGKTAFSANLAYEITSQKPNVHVDFFTLEMTKREMVNRMVSIETGINSGALKNPYFLNDKQKEFIRLSLDNYRKKFIRVYDTEFNLPDILRIIRKNAAKSKPNEYVAIIDYIGLVNVPGNQERYLQVGEVTRQLKQTANEFDIPIIALAQLSRQIENRQDKRPTLSDLRESGSIEQDSSAVGFLYCPDEEIRNIECLSIQKNREGGLADIDLNFNREKMRFKEIPKEAIR